MLSDLANCFVYLLRVRLPVTPSGNTNVVYVTANCAVATHVRVIQCAAKPSDLIDVDSQYQDPDFRDVQGKKPAAEGSGQAWPSSVTRVVAAQIRLWRERRGLSALQLSERTKGLGYHIPRSVIANLENDRRDTISVAEILVVAAALDVPPIMLITAVGQEPAVEILPNVVVTPWKARGWIVGAVDPGYGRFSPNAWQESRQAIALYDVHLEKAASELVGPVRHDIWDVHCSDSRWWVVTNPTNLYDQNDFKSRDVVLTFHIGLTLRLEYLREREVPLAPTIAELLPGSWRRWQQAFEALDSGDEAENYQAVGVRLRECLVSFVGETRSDDLVPDGISRPKNADFKGWTALLANAMAPGDSAANLRSYLKSTAVETWTYVNWLTHAKNALRMDAEIGLKMVEHLLGLFTAARMRLGGASGRCGECGSYGVVGGTCQHCGWVDTDYEPPALPALSDDERARRLAEPCTPSSDIRTFVSPEGIMIDQKDSSAG